MRRLRDGGSAKVFRTERCQLATVIGMACRRGVGWAVAEHLRAKLFTMILRILGRRAIDEIAGSPQCRLSGEDAIRRLRAPALVLRRWSSRSMPVVPPAW